MMKKYVKDLTVRAVERLHERYVLLRLTDDEPLPGMMPGQFVEVRVDDAPYTFLRRPISICNVDRERNELWLLVACVGEGTRRMALLSAGDRLNCMLPLGNGWSLGAGSVPTRRLLVGGGVGVAPLLFLGATLSGRNHPQTLLASEGAACDVTFLLGARSAKDLLLLSAFEQYGRVLVTTEDGSAGERGFVTQHPVLARERFDLIQSCGPTPMMKAVARYARQTGTPCEVSLENLMACGLGACLCCVERAHPQPLPEGGEPDAETFENVCVCKEGPVFNIDRLLWQD